MIEKKDLISQLKNTDIDLGISPASTLHYYETRGILPRVLSIGIGRGKGIRSYYPDRIWDMLSDVKMFQREGCLLRLVKRLIREKYADVFIRSDLLLLCNLNNFDWEVVEKYLEKAGKEMDRGFIKENFFFGSSEGKWSQLFRDWLIETFDQELAFTGSVKKKGK